MKNNLILAAAALVVGNLAVAEIKSTPPPSTKVNSGLPVAAVQIRADLTISPKPAPGHGPLYDFKIENVGKVPSKETTIRFYAMPPCKRHPNQPAADIGNGKLIGSLPLKALVVTTSPSYAFSASMQMPESLRGCRMRARVDAEQAVSEMSEDNNDATIETSLPPRPDLTTTMVQPSGGGDRYFLVRNGGGAQAGPSVLYVRCTSQKVNVHGNDVYPCDPTGNNPSKTWTWNVPALAVGADFKHAVPIPGFSAHFELRADSNNQVLESNESNNVWPSSPPY